MAGALTRTSRLFCVSGMKYHRARMPSTTRNYALQSYQSTMIMTPTTPTTTPMTTPMTRMSSKMTMVTTNTAIQHGVQVQNKKFPCSNCSSAFSRKGGLTYHRKFECGQEPRFSCPYCFYRTWHISNTRRHVRKCHSGKDVYAVDLGKQERPNNSSRVGTSEVVQRHSLPRRSTIHEDTSVWCSKNLLKAQHQRKKSLIDFETAVAP